MLKNKENTPKVISNVVSNDLCIGCGVCVYACGSSAIEMNWNETGFLIPRLKNTCDLDGACIQVCPFNPKPIVELLTEDEISEKLNFIGDFDSRIGRFKGLYAGYSEEFRMSSSSGGIVTYVLNELFDKGIIDHVITVREKTESKDFFEYSIVSNSLGIKAVSKTRYYPVTLANALNELKQLTGKVAVVGVGCFIKSLRLAQYHDHFLKEKIVFQVGIICGGVKSKFYTDYLVGKIGIDTSLYYKPEYRIKDSESNASDYIFGCKSISDKMNHQLRMKTVGDMWGTGLFKANACDFCDDVTAELADISLGDAWIHPYNQDGKGNNVIITRSELANQIIETGTTKHELKIDVLSIDKVISSQQGNFNHRHKGLATRIKIAKSRHVNVPPKRERLKVKASVAFKVVQVLRMFVRKKSLTIWTMYANTEIFDNKMKFILKILFRMTDIYHIVERNRGLAIKELFLKVKKHTVL